MSPPRLLQDNAGTSLFPAGVRPEPFGDVAYLSLVERYAREALERKAQGADRLVLRGMPGLHGARAAVLGARSTGLPVYVSLAIAPDGKPMEGQVLLAALLCLQELGIAAFGLDFDYVTGDVLEMFNQIAPYAKVPLLARPQGATTADRFAAMIRSGAEVLCCEAADPQQAEAISQAIAVAAPVARPPRPEDNPLLLCDETGVYYLEEDFTLSEGMDCSLDMSEVILDQEDDAVDALCFLVETVDDARNLGLNAHMARCAVCVQAAGKAALEMALALYTGRALVDARSDVEETALHALAAAYGAIVR